MVRRHGSILSDPVSFRASRSRLCACSASRCGFHRRYFRRDSRLRLAADPDLGAGRGVRTPHIIGSACATLPYAALTYRKTEGMEIRNRILVGNEPVRRRKNAMRILHVFGQMNRGGAEMRTLDLMRYQSIAGAISSSSAVPPAASAASSTGEIIEPGRRVHPIGPRSPLFFQARFRKLLRHGKFEAVHSSHLHYFRVISFASRQGKAAVSGSGNFRSTHDGHADNLPRRLQRTVMRYWLDRFRYQGFWA